MESLKLFKENLLVNERRVIPYASSDPAEIWHDVVLHDLDQIRYLCRAMQVVISEKAPLAAFKMVAWLFYMFAYRRRGEFIKETDYLARQSGIVSPHEMALLQRQYTFAHAFCSSVTVWDHEKQHLVCMRSLDWKGAEGIAACTRIFEFVNSKNRKVAEVAGIAGMVGVLTAVKKGFSIAINYAPWRRSARFYTDPTFLARHLIQDESIDSYEKAVRAIMVWKVGAPCFFTVCGEKKGESAVIEFGGRGKQFVRRAREDGLLIQTNHYDAGSDFAVNNETPYSGDLSSTAWYSSDLQKNSMKRREQLENELKTTEKTSALLERQLITVFSKPPVMNHLTAQWVLMRPREGTMQVWACRS